MINSMWELLLQREHHQFRENGIQHSLILTTSTCFTEVGAKLKSHPVCSRSWQAMNHTTWQVWTTTKLRAMNGSLRQS